MELLLIYWSIMLVTYFTASRLRKYREKLAVFPHITMVIVYVIVLLMGLRMGADQQVMNNLGSIGFQAIV